MWGLEICAVGRTSIPPHSPYPLEVHPKEWHFSFDRGRAIHSLALIAIRSGCGVFELANERHVIRENMAFVLLPGEWHRYRPRVKTGWVEDWFVVRGPAAERWIAAGLFRRKVFRLRVGHSFWRRFDELHRVCNGEQAPAEGVTAGLATTLLAEAIGARNAAAGYAARVGGPRWATVCLAREMIAAGRKVSTVAVELGVSYPTLHRWFTASTGMSPSGYGVQVRLKQAENLLLGGDLSVKEIAARLGFHSASHFSSHFKKYSGVAPRYLSGNPKIKAG
ncbi:MAG: AraC family transcriptional regulator [Terrimicrobiaceae bacterium]